MKLILPVLLLGLLAVKPSTCILMDSLQHLLNWGKSPKWDVLKVTWLKYSTMPLTIEEAKSAGFVKADDTDSCEGKQMGFRYYMPDDLSVATLYDKAGYIAGIQANYPKNLITADNMTKWFPQSNLMIDNQLGGNDTYSVTAYLVDPTIICTTGRKKEEFDESPSGTNVTFLTKGDPIQTSRKQGGIDTNVWTEGRCFPSMGKHYWVGTSVDMNCNDFKPVFLLYNAGELTGFGFASFNTFNQTKRYEYPPTRSFALFMKEVPKCLQELSNEVGVSTMHVFMNSKPWNLAC